MSLTGRLRGVRRPPPAEPPQPPTAAALPSAPAPAPAASPQPPPTVEEQAGAAGASPVGNGEAAPVTAAPIFELPPPPELLTPPLTLRASSISRDLRRRVRDQLIDELGPDVRKAETADVRQRIRTTFDRLMENETVMLSRGERERLLEDVTADLIGFGPIEPLLADPRITEVMVNGPDQVFIEQDGLLYEVDITFDDEAHLRRIIDRIVSPIGRRVDEASPLCDARLPDGSRVNITLPPVSLVGPTVTIRKFFKTPLGVEDLIRFGTLTPEIAEFLRACVIARLNIVVSGNTGAGKTTLLNVMSGFIPRNERIITIEDAAELRLQQKHVVRFESRPPNIEGQGTIAIRDLVVNCLRMRPDRILVGECRSREALDMLQAMNTGHDGSLTTVHSNSPRDTLARLETMVLMAGMELPVRAIREQVSSALDMIVHMDRLRDGSRKITAVTEVQGMEGDIIVLQDVFKFEQDAFEEGRIIGRIVPTGVRPRCVPKLEDAGVRLSPAVFGLQL